jgi:hypothetical protein
MKHLIFHLNILADPSMIRAHTQVGVARMLGEIYGNEQSWFSAYGKILADWDSYHSDLNFSGDDGMVDMREARFRIMRALFRITGKAEPSQDEIHLLANRVLRVISGDVFFHDSHDLLNHLAPNHTITLISYLPQAQLEAIAKDVNAHHYIGADTFEQYEMNRHYFEMLLTRLQATPEECLYIDKQEKVLEAAFQTGIKTFEAKGEWVESLKNSL